jgi:hypothetical protein
MRSWVSCLVLAALLGGTGACGPAGEPETAAPGASAAVQDTEFGPDPDAALHAALVPLRRIAHALSTVGTTKYRDVYGSVILRAESGTVLLSLTDLGAAPRVIAHARKVDRAIEVDRIRLARADYTEAQLLAAMDRIGRHRDEFSARMAVLSPHLDLSGLHLQLRLPGVSAEQPAARARRLGDEKLARKIARMPVLVTYFDDPGRPLQG